MHSRRVRGKRWYFLWSDRSCPVSAGVRWSAADQATKGPADHGSEPTHFHWNDREDLQARAGDPAARDAAIVAPKERFCKQIDENGENPVHGMPGTVKRVLRGVLLQTGTTTQIFKKIGRT